MRCDTVGKRPRTRRRPHIENMGQIHLGDDVNINSRNVQTDLVSGPNGSIEIGNEASINFGVSIVANKKIKIGDRVRIGPYTMIYDSNMHVHGNRYERAEGDPVVIEDDVWLATRVIVLKGARIGKGSVIAAGSVVSGIIPPYVVAAGVPARIIKYISPSESSGFMWERKPEYGRKLDEITLSRVLKVASEIFSVKIEHLNEKHSHHAVNAWDAFRHVKFIYALEREFDITFESKDWSRISSIEKTCQIVQCYLESNVAKKKIGIKKTTHINPGITLNPFHPNQSTNITQQPKEDTYDCPFTDCFAQYYGIFYGISGLT